MEPDTLEISIPTVTIDNTNILRYDEFNTQTPELRTNSSSPTPRRKKHKLELAQIQKILSIYRPKSINPRYSNIDSYNSERSASGTTRQSHIELYMEICWCFSCCLSTPFRKCFEKICFRKEDTENDIENGIDKNVAVDNYCNYCNTRVYECIYKLFFSPIFDNDESKLTKSKKLVILVRLSFELYKTMIGSYLTIFTPQKCNDGICTLTDNLIPKDNMEIAALAINSFMAFSLLCEYMIEFTREKVLRLYFENDPRLPIEKEYFTNLLGILDTKKATLLNEKTIIIRYIFQLYRRIGIILLSIYIANITISGIVIYKNYYDKSSLFGFVTNALFIVFKMASILKIAIHSIKIPYSAYIESPVAFNSLKPEYIQSEIKAQYMFRNMADYASLNENAQYFMDNRQYMRFLLENNDKTISTKIPKPSAAVTVNESKPQYSVNIMASRPDVFTTNGNEFNTHHNRTLESTVKITGIEMACEASYSVRDIPDERINSTVIYRHRNSFS